jgi:hypothetical protein
MAPSVLTVLTAARTGSRVVRYLIRPAWKVARHRLAPWPRDPWALAPRKGWPGGRPLRPARHSELGRRALGFTGLLLRGVLGVVVVVPLLVLFGGLLALGIDAAGWLLGLTLLLAVLGLIRTAVRGARLLSAPATEEAAGTRPSGALALSPGQDEDHLLTLLRSSERALPAATRPALHATVIATRDALRATADDPALDRDAFDARQAAREDLPALLHTYQAAPRTPETERLFLGQLDLIGRRMQAVAQERQNVHVRTLETQRRYLESKYGEDRK